MSDTVFMWTGAFIWGAMIGACWVVVCVVIPYTVIDFISKTIAAWVFLGKGHVQLKAGWSRLGTAANYGWHMLLARKCQLHSNNNWMVSLYYSHPFKWQVVSHWDEVEEVEEDDA
ncbi:hypothetical protein [Phytohalomonas tamaricis]|uniref:hypothetical protein n=1 Tax=Phytohalomonas tamaricis TaxID=2081032 RepID=UPI00131A3C0C|nr:hypothetical protein [Phytohalomonas tamaricis]